MAFGTCLRMSLMPWKQIRSVEQTWLAAVAAVAVAAAAAVVVVVVVAAVAAVVVDQMVIAGEDMRLLAVADY
jgi:L-asparagine transporter-like permease